MTDLESFIHEIELFLTEEDTAELVDKAGVRFPLKGCSWSDLCYICCWMGMKRGLPESIHNRMILGESNGWSRIYIRVLEYRANFGPSFAKDIGEFFNLAG